MKMNGEGFMGIYNYIYLLFYYNRMLGWRYVCLDVLMGIREDIYLFVICFD